MRPTIICHMLSTIDGKINGEAIEAVANLGEYEVTAATLGGNAWLCGRRTMQQHFAEPEPFTSASNKPAGPRPVHVARWTASYAISVDTLGKLCWPGSEIDEAHLICVVSEQAPEDYLEMLREKDISYIVSGKSRINLVRAMELLGEHFGIRRLLLEGGGRINGAFLQADLVDELSLLVAPGIDGHHDIPTVFDGMFSMRKTAVPLKLKSIEQRANDLLWLRYEVVHAQTGEKQDPAEA